MGEGCCSCACYRRGAADRAEQDAAYATYRVNVAAGEGAFWADHRADMTDPEYAEQFRAAFDAARSGQRSGVNTDWVLDVGQVGLRDALQASVNRWHE